MEGFGEPLQALAARRAEAGGHDPGWAVLVASVMLNLTRREQAEPVVERILERWPGPEQLRSARYSQIRSLISRLGLGGRRASLLRSMAREYLRQRPRDAEDVLRLPGCGRYAADTWAIFVEGRTDLTPRDALLAAHLRREIRDGNGPRR